MKRPVSLKKFNGEVYHWQNWYMKKSSAKAEADKHRNKGRKARVISQGGLWHVYVRK